MKDKLINCSFEVPLQQTWDLTHIFENEEEYEKNVGIFKESATKFKEKYEHQVNQISDVNDLVEAIKDYEDIITIYSRLIGFAYLDTQTDMAQSKSQSRLGSISMLGSQLMSSLTFFESEIKQLSDEFLTDAANNSGYAIYLEDVIKLKSRQLQPESEMILAALNPVLELPRQWL